MSKKISKEAVTERTLRMVPQAQEIFEELLKVEDVACPNCGETIKTKKISEATRRMAVDIMKMAGFGPIDRHKREDPAEITEEELKQALLDWYTELTQNEKVKLITTMTHQLDAASAMIVTNKLRNRLLPEKVDG